MIPPQLAVMLAVFTVAAIALFRSKHERHSIVFMVRSQYGIKLIEFLAKRYGPIWNGLADFSIVLAFGGLGGWYLGSHGQNKSLQKSVLGMALLFAAASLFANDLPLAAGIITAGLLSLAYIGRGNHHADFLLTSAVITLGCSIVFAPSFAVFMGMFGMPAVMIFVLVSHGMNILSAETDMPGISPMLPSSKDGNVGVSFPGYDIFIPWWHALVALFTTLVVHEGCHGLLVRTAGVKLKSTGILTVLSLPIGAFVEPDEEELEKHASIDKMRVFSAGPFANFVVGIAAAMAIVALALPLAAYFVSDGMIVLEQIEGFPAEGVIPPETVIYSIDGIQTNDWPSYIAASSTLSPGSNATLNTSTGAYSLILAERPDDPKRGFMGVVITENRKMRTGGAAVPYPYLKFVSDALFWIMFFNINIGLVNLLPIVPFDGGRMLKEMAETFSISKMNVNRLLYIVVSITLILFLVNMIPLLRMIYDFAISLV